MNNKLTLTCLLLTLLYVACKDEKAQSIEHQKGKSAITKTVDTFQNKRNLVSDLRKKDDEDFNAFFELFAKDSMFQKSRINFPITVSLLNTDSFEMESSIIYKENFLFFQLNKQPNNQEYAITTILSKTEAKIEIRGKDNGILKDLFFKKEDGKWLLITWTDQST